MSTSFQFKKRVIVSNTVTPPNAPLEEFRSRWIDAADQASALSVELFQSGSGYGCPEAEMQDRHRLETARCEAERRFREYEDLERARTQREMLRLQRSQQLATWGSFCVAAAVGIATIVQVVLSIAR
jgi:hypothetical protein